MKVFQTNINLRINKFSDEENEWRFSFKRYSKITIASLKSPSLKEITYSSGPTVRYVKHNVFCIGVVKKQSIFSGVAFFDIPERILVWFLLPFLFGGLGSVSICWGCIGGLFFYLLASFLSISQDELLMSIIKRRLMR